MRFTHLRSRQPQAGRTLVELMIAIAIGLIILLALSTVYLGTTSTSRQSTTISRMSEDAAIAFNLVGGSLRAGGSSPPRVLVLPGGAIVGGATVEAPDRNFTGASVRGCDDGFTAETAKGAFDDLACNAGGNGPAAVAIRFEGDEWNTVPVGGKASDCLQHAVQSQVNSAIDPALQYTLVDSRFFVAASGSGTPELKCAGNGGTGATIFNPEPLLELVEDVQLRYGVAADGVSRDVQQYATAAEVDALGGASVDANWSRVVNIRVCMVMRSQNRDQAGSGNYINCDGNSVASAGGFARRSFTSVYALRNRSGFLVP